MRTVAGDVRTIHAKSPDGEVAERGGQRGAADGLELDRGRHEHARSALVKLVD